MPLPFVAWGTWGPCTWPCPHSEGPAGVCTGSGGLFAAPGSGGAFGIRIVLPLPPDRAQTWAGHVSPEPSPLHEKSWLGSQDLQFSHPNKVSARKRAVSRATAMPRSSGVLGWHLGSLRISPGVGWSAGRGWESGWGRLGGVSRGCGHPPSLTEMLHCHLVTAAPGTGAAGGTEPGWAPAPG